MRMMKYVVFQSLDSPAWERMYLIPQEDAHKAFVERMPMDGWRPIRAGQVMFDCGRFRCSGSSMSLGLMADEEKDTDLLLNQLAYEGAASQFKNTKI